MMIRAERFRWTRFAVTAAIVSVTSFSFAQTQDSPAEHDAQLLFDTASTLMDAGNYLEACPKLEKATELIPDGIGAKLALGECYVGSHRLYSACLEYIKAERIAKSKGDERAKDAFQGCEKISNRVPKVIIDTRKLSTNFAGWSISIDGTTRHADFTKSRTHQETSFLVDHGSHVFEIFIDERRIWSRWFSVENGETLRIAIPNVPPFSTAPTSPVSNTTPISSTRKNVGATLILGSGILSLIAGAIVTGNGVATPKGGDDAIGAGICLMTFGTMVVTGWAISAPPSINKDQNGEVPPMARSPSPQLQFDIAPNGVSLKGTF